ncbi:MAG TPA: PEP-CTERM sorting domain-containing protein [Verrucomicrobiota bacterium]|nr:PEP-CTERM sorting domain-containing protein [Verrucomicrobiota bacterium]
MNRNLDCHSRFSGVRSLVVALTLCISGAMSTNAGLIAYEGFDYAPDAGISGLNGGFGWGNSWVTAGGSEFATNVSGSLSYGGVSSTGNALRVGVASDLSQGNPGTQAPQRNLENPLGTYGSTIWIGLLWQSLTTDAERGSLAGFRETKIGFFDGANPASMSRTGTERVAVGIPHTYTANGTVNGVPNQQLLDEYSIYLSSTQQASGVATERGTDPANTVFLLLRMDLDGTAANDTLSLWVNPNVGAGEGGLGAAMAIWNTVNLDAINGFRFQVANSNASGINGQMLVDELRIGTTFADTVTGIPEPGALALVGIGAAALMIVVRRNRRNQ